MYTFKHSLLVIVVLPLLFALDIPSQDVLKDIELIIQKVCHALKTVIVLYDSEESRHSIVFCMKRESRKFKVYVCLGEGLFKSLPKGTKRRG